VTLHREGNDKRGKSSVFGDTVVVLETVEANSTQWHSLYSDYAVIWDTSFEGKSAMHEQQYLS
jgi:hypothetical protein